MNTRLVGFTGRKGSGKTTAAKHLVKVHDGVIVSFARPLKEMLRPLGLSDEELSGSLKEAPHPLLAGRTPRYAMQTLGTEWGRQLMSDDLWVGLWRRAVLDEFAAGVRLVVADDVRFPNEVEAIHRLGGLVIRVDRPVSASDKHPSESETDSLEVDWVLDNNYTLDSLYAKLSKAV